jgi:hypothetical protein
MISWVLNGTDGAKGNIGDTGLTGAKGNIGDTGLTGAKGNTGDTGLTGAKGNTGDTGLTGAKGDTGTTGAKGDTGVNGDKGQKGVEGPDGPDGPKGDKGIIGIPGFSAAVYNFAKKTLGEPGLTVWADPPITAAGVRLDASEFLNLEGFVTIIGSVPAYFPTYPALTASTNPWLIPPVPGAPGLAGSNNNFYGRVLPADGYVTYLAANFIEIGANRDCKIRVVIANAAGVGGSLVINMITEEINMDPVSSSYGSLSIPVDSGQDAANFSKGSYIFAISYAEDSRRLPPLGYVSVSVYVNFKT